MRLTLKDVRLSFPNLWEPVQYKGTGPFTYRAAFLMTEDSENKAWIDTAIKEVATQKWGVKTAKYLPAIIRDNKLCAFSDGNEKEYDGYAGQWVLSAVRKQVDGPPKVVDRDPAIEIAQTDNKLYAGCYVNAVVDIWAQDSDFGKAIRAGLIAVQFLRDGESFGGAAQASTNGLEDLSYEELSADSTVTKY